MDKLIQAVLDAISDLMIDRSGPWRETRDAILKNATEEERGNLLEFVAWFEEIEDDE